MLIWGDVCTCHYAGLAQLMKDNKDRKGFFLVQVSNSRPNGFTVDYTWSNSYPGWPLLNEYKNHQINDNGYTQRYAKEVLHDKWGMLLKDWAEIVKMAKGRLIVLLCWEAPGQFCHRILLKQFLFEEGLIYAVLNQDIITDYEQYQMFNAYEREDEWNQIVGYSTYTE